MVAGSAQDPSLSLSYWVGPRDAEMSREWGWAPGCTLSSVLTSGLTYRIGVNPG